MGNKICPMFCLKRTSRVELLCIESDQWDQLPTTFKNKLLGLRLVSLSDQGFYTIFVPTNWSDNVRQQILKVTESVFYYHYQAPSEDADDLNKIPYPSNLLEKN